MAVLRARDPFRAFVTVMRELYPDALRPSSLFDAKGVAPGTFVHASARLENGVVVDPGAVIGPRAEVGAGIVWASPFGPLRLDYAIALSKTSYDRTQEISFGGGTKF